MATKKIFLVDTENVGSTWKDLLPAKAGSDQILLFFTENSPYVSYTDLQMILQFPDRFEMIKCNPGKNGLDFQLVSYLGYLMKTASKANYVIVSNDGGFDAVVKFWQDRGMSVSRMNVYHVLQPDVAQVTETAATPAPPKQESQKGRRGRPAASGQKAAAVHRGKTMQAHTATAQKNAVKAADTAISDTSDVSLPPPAEPETGSPVSFSETANAPAATGSRNTSSAIGAAAADGKNISPVGGTAAADGKNISPVGGTAAADGKDISPVGGTAAAGSKDISSAAGTAATDVGTLAEDTNLPAVGMDAPPENKQTENGLQGNENASDAGTAKTDTDAPSDGTTKAAKTPAKRQKKAAAASSKKPPEASVLDSENMELDFSNLTVSEKASLLRKYLPKEFSENQESLDIISDIMFGHDTTNHHQLHLAFVKNFGDEKGTLIYKAFRPHLAEFRA